MVDTDNKSCIAESDDYSELLNENGKRPSDGQNKDGKKRIKTKSLYRQPTVNELNRLQETENLFNSNLFRLQIEEILHEVKVTEKTDKKFRKWFDELRTHLLVISEDETEYDLSENILSKNLKVKLPIDGEIKKSKCMFKFHKFKDVKIVGSYALGCSINSKLVIDVQIVVPMKTYTKNDSINYKYHKKRAAYLAFLASHLKKLDIIEDIKYSFSNGSQTKPVLSLKPNGKLGNHLTVSIDLVCEEGAYKFHRFGPKRNNLRESWLFNETTENNEIGPPTPYYNSSILLDITGINEEYLNEILGKSENLKQAIVLLKIWLRQRYLPVSGFIIGMFVAYLVQAKRINNIMSSYQIVRNVWISLKTSEWDTKGITLFKGKDSPPMEQFLEHFPVVFLDRTGYYNICWRMHSGTYNALRTESVLAVEMLDNSRVNGFIPLFMVPVQPLMHFDHILRFKDLTKLKESIKSRISRESQLNYGVDELALITDTLHKLLVKGLGNRVDLIVEQIEANFSWPVKTTLRKAKTNSYEEKLCFGINLNTENCLNTVEKGPSANLPEAEEFRAFWGDKSELRRFQDGSITEACVWQADTLAERRGVTKQIIDYLLQLKYDINPNECFHICDQLESVTTRKKFASDRALQVAECSAEVIRTLDELGRDLRALKDLPLDVSAIYGTSPVFSYCDPLPALRCSAPQHPWKRGDSALLKDPKEDGEVTLPVYTPVNAVVIELGYSGKWPGDIEAFRCLKAAFYSQISECLRKQSSLAAQPHLTHLDVLKQGLVFRVEIAHPKEITLLKRETENGVVKLKESEQSVKVQCDTILLPRLRGALHGLHQKHPAFGATACIFKRWLSCHLLSSVHFSATVAELLVASVFVRPHPLTPPANPTCGFFRALRLLAHTDWSTEILVLDFHEDMTSEEILEIERKFSTRTDETPSLCIVTAYDGDLPSVWSATSPSPRVLGRSQALARTTLRYMERALLVDFTDNVLPAFVPSLSGYDLVIHLRTSLVPYSSERLDRPPELRRLPEAADEQILPVVDFDPVDRYLRDLRSAFDEFALFFHDSFGGDQIAVLWKPHLKDIMDFQLSNPNGLKPVVFGNEVKYKINTEAIVEDFRVMGEGLVTDITVNNY